MNETQPNSAGRYYTIAELIDMLPFSRTFWWRAMRDKRLSHFKISNRIAISDSQLREFLERHEVRACEQRRRPREVRR